MRAFTNSELSAMRQTQTSAMMDTCVVLIHGSGAIDAYGNPSAGYSEGSPVRCGYHPGSSREVQQGNETVLVDATLRLPVGTVINSRDRVRLTHRFGEVLATPLLFDVMGQPAQGPSGLLVNLRRVTDESQ